MRNIAITRGPKLYSPEDREVVKKLQAHLNALGCDVGAVDGIIGSRTREAAEKCREFYWLDWPGDLDISTVRKIVALYEKKYPVP
jgi:hypothetical protein